MDRHNKFFRQPGLFDPRQIQLPNNPPVSNRGSLTGGDIITLMLTPDSILWSVIVTAAAASLTWMVIREKIDSLLGESKNRRH